MEKRGEGEGEGGESIRGIGGGKGILKRTNSLSW